MTGRLRNIDNGALAGLWGCSIVRGASAVVHPWGTGGSTSSLEVHRPAALMAARKLSYGGGVVGTVGGGSASVGQLWHIATINRGW